MNARTDFGKASEKKPSLDQWSALVGVATGISRDLRADERTRLNHSEATAIFSRIVNAMLEPYAEMQKNLLALEDGKPNSEDHKAAIINHGLARLGAAAMFVAEAASDLAQGLPAESARPLQSLSVVLNAAVRREVTGFERAEGQQNFINQMRKSEPLLRRHM